MQVRTILNWKHEELIVTIIERREEKGILQESISTDFAKWIRQLPLLQDFHLGPQWYVQKVLSTHPSIPTLLRYISNLFCSPNSFFRITPGKHHIEKCPVLKSARLTAKSNDVKLVMVGGIDIDEDLLSNVSLPTPKPAKIDGFVMSSSVLLSDPRRAPSGVDSNSRQRTGRKGYTRCLKCNAETYGPNTSRHSCHGKRVYRKNPYRTKAWFAMNRLCKLRFLASLSPSPSKSLRLEGP